jgi:hypothetical protein
MDQDREYWVESEPPDRQGRRPAQRMEDQRRSQLSPRFVLFVFVPTLLFLLLIQAVADALSKSFMGPFWNAIHPWLVVACAITLVISGAILGWHLYLRWHDARLHHFQRQAYKQRLLQAQEAREENLAMGEQTKQIVEEARTNGDNVKMSFDKDGRVIGLEVIRSLNLQAQWQLEYERQRQQLANQAVVLRAGDTAIFPGDDYRRVESEIALPAGGRKQLPQHAGSKTSGPALLREAKIVVPEPYDLLDVIDQVPEDEVFLGIDHYGRLLSCSPFGDDLCHGALNAITGKGKTILIRGLETQLLAMGAEVLHADIKFTLSDEKGNDYRPIARALLEQGEMPGLGLPHLLMREDHIYQMIQWLAGPELARRRALYHRGDHSFGAFYLVLEELAYLLGTYKELGQLIGKILVVGRSLGVKVFAVAQNFQVQNLKINSGMRENFESAWYLGGDMNSGAAVLDLSEAELRMILAQHQIRLGDGVSLFRNNKKTGEATVLRAGMASNNFVHRFLGRADGLLLPDYLLPSEEELLAREQRAGTRRVRVEEEMPPLESFTKGSVASGVRPVRPGEKPGVGQSVARNTTGQMPQNTVDSALVSEDDCAQENAVDQPGESAQGAQSRAKYRLTEQQVAMFCQLYPDIIENKDECLRKIGANTAYRVHANELILQHNLMAKKRRA